MTAGAWRSPTDLQDRLAVPLVARDATGGGENSHHYQVVAVAPGRAWVRCIRHGTDHVISLGLSGHVPDAPTPGAISCS